MTTHTPRTRDGQKFAGGKYLRKAKATLEARINNWGTMKSSGGYSKPGSMSK